MAKAALNQGTMTIAQELKADGSNISFLSVNPGWIPTRMTSGKGDTDVVESVEGIIKLGDEVTMKNTGQFRKWNGEVIQW